jgi:cytochrome c2
MTFAGISKPAEIADIIAYLRKQNDAPPALPK